MKSVQSSRRDSLHDLTTVVLVFFFRFSWGYQPPPINKLELNERIDRISNRNDQTLPAKQLSQSNRPKRRNPAGLPIEQTQPTDRANKRLIHPTDKEIRTPQPLTSLMCSRTRWENAARSCTKQAMHTPDRQRDLIRWELHFMMHSRSFGADKIPDVRTGSAKRVYKSRLYDTALAWDLYDRHVWQIYQILISGSRSFGPDL